VCRRCHTDASKPSHHGQSARTDGNYNSDPWARLSLGAGPIVNNPMGNNALLLGQIIHMQNIYQLLCYATKVDRADRFHVALFRADRFQVAVQCKARVNHVRSSLARV
jgi:hypothetical protein